MYSSKLSLQIRRAQDQLSEQLQVTESLTDYLYQEHVFEESEIMRIRFAQTPSGKASQMVRILQTRSDEDISKFILKLKEPESQPWLADEILSKAIEDAEKELTAEFNSTRSSKRMEAWSVDEVCGWLKSIQQDDVVIETFRSEKISGDVLSTVTMTDIEGFCPAAKFGDRSRIIRNRDLELKKETEKSSSGRENTDDVGDIYASEKFQNFGRRGGCATAYSQYTFFTKESVSTDNLIEPMHVFFGLQDVDSQEALYQFSVEVVPFICACLNERTNGTCHFGVDKEGMIHGIPADGNQFQQLLGSVIETCFSRDQLEIVKGCVRPVTLVEVKRKTPGEQLYVVEIDVVPVYRLCADEAFFARPIRRDLRSTERREYEISSVYRFHEGLAIGCSGENLKSYMENKVQMAIKRRGMELLFLQAGKHGVQSDFLSDKLTKLLCRGEDTLDGDIYPIFVLSPNSGVGNSDGKTQFLYSIERKTVFDFDNASSPNSAFTSHEEHSGATSNVLSVEYFNSCKNDVSELLDDCSQPWIFCNGLERTSETVLDASEWKLRRRPAFSKAVELFHDAIPREHVIVVFLLLSDNCDAMLSAAEELCVRFKWLVISESQQLASKFKDHLIKTLKVVPSEEEFERQSIVGMPWLQVSEVFRKLVGYVSIGQTELPTSAASKVFVSKKALNEMKDLEVLGSTHLSNASIVLNNDAEKLNELRLDVERRFYQGVEVDWWNFWFQGQVLTRDVQHRILSCIQSLFAKQLNETGDRVGFVTIYHAPGSGATTLAKHVLWELKGQYRCAVLRTLTKDTPNQLTRLITHQETSNPKPVLLLLDNYDELQIQDLKADLELEARNLGKDIEKPPPVPFVLLVCIRCSFEAQQTTDDCDRRFEIGHSLNAFELQWFRTRYEQLETEWQSKQRFDPRLLISINIFRENFKRHFVECKATSFVKFVTSYSERLLLKYVALVGAYDPEFHCIPASCFDQLMNDQRQFESSWLNRISESLKVLLISNGSNTGAGFPMKRIRIAHPLLACHIFREVVSEFETPADVMLEFLLSDLFRFKDVATKQLLKTVTSLLTRRLRQRDGLYKHEFTPLILSVIEDHTQDRTKVINIFKRALELEDDHLIAQQLARLYIYTKDWSSAEESVVRLTEKYPTKETAWHTCGMVYKEQLFHRFKEIQRPVTVEEVESSLGLLRRAIEMFQKEENLGMDPNGLICEGDTILAFIDNFKRIIGYQDTELRRFLIDCDYVPSFLTSWKQESTVYVRSLVIRIIYISEELESYREEISWFTNPSSIQEPRIKKHRELVIKLTEGFRSYFVDDSSQSASGLCPEASTHSRKRQIFILKGNTLIQSLEHCRQGSITTLEQIRFLAEQNLKMPDRNMRDVQTFVRTTLLIFITSGNRTDNSGYELFVKLKQMIQELVSITETFESDQIQIEAYLFFTLLNWPTGESPQDTETILVLKTILDRWEKVVNKRNGNQGCATRRYTSRVFFSIGAGSNLNRIFIDRNNNCPVWFRGVVTSEGKKVSYCFKEHLIVIPQDGVQHRSRWETSVFFRIGFTWSGPVALDVALEDPRMPCPQVPVAPCQPEIPVNPPQPVTPCQPQIPVVPPQPEIPVAPCQPELPVAPCQPEIPVAPCQPEIPVVPCQPVAPCQPAVPANPCARAPHHRRPGHCHQKHHCHHKHKKHH